MNLGSLPCLFQPTKNLSWHRKKKPYQSSLAMPRSLQQRMSALLLHPSVAVGIPFGSKYSCSPRAMLTRLQIHALNTPHCIFNVLYLPPHAYKRVLSTHNFWSNIRITSWGQAPPTRAECLVEYTAIFDFRKIQQTVYGKTETMTYWEMK
jgi:hypothetical protein